MIDLRSDTVTRPSAAMRKAMAEAEVGDDVMSEDPTLNKLQEEAAALTGKEAAIFVPSGTFANQLALFTWVPTGGEIYINEKSHIVQYEAGAPACISGAFMRPFTPSGKWAEWQDFSPRIRRDRDEHFPRPALLCLENALSNGCVQPLESMQTIKKESEALGLPVHLDGARLFNAACSLGIDAREIAAQADSLMFCFSKGLGAPVGSILCGSRDFIQEARYKRKIMGGGMRQAGVIAAAALVALQEELPRLHQDHEHAQKLADAFKPLDAFELINPTPDINMVFVKLTLSPNNTLPANTNNERFTTLLAQHGILTFPQNTHDGTNATFRFVTHRDISPRDINKVIAALPKIAQQLQQDSAK